MSTKKEVAALLEQKQPQAKNHTHIIAEEPKSVKPNLRELAQLREHAKIKAMDMVEVVQTLYPRYDKYIHSKCENGKEYGIQLRPDATKALLQRFAPEFLEKPRKPNRKKPNRIQARLPDALFAQLQLHLQQSGQTAQDFLEGLVAQFFKPPDNPKE